MSEQVTRELHLEERPGSFKSMIGQPEAVAQLVALAKMDGGLPHCLLFSGPSGCGKTTLARICKKKLECGSSDFFEVNAADSRGIEMVRNIQQRVGLAPIDGASRVWLIDECHQLTADAQGAFLKLFEEPPPHVYFMLATTHPEKLKDAIRTRCTEIKVRPLNGAEITELVEGVLERHDKTLDGKVTAKIAEVADGSARKALVLLQQVMGIGDVAAQLDALQAMDAQAAAIEIARAIMAKKGWKVVAPILASCKEDPESIRWMMLSYFSKVALGTGNMAAAAINVMDCFQFNYFDTKRAGLILSCYNACQR